MRIYATVNDRTARRSFRERKHRKRPLTVLDHTLPAFGFTVANDDTRTYFVRVVRKLGAANIALGKTTETTADEARAKAVAEIEAAQVERKAGPLMRDFADEFIRRRAHRWKPSTRKSNLHLLKRYILPPLGGIRVAEMTRADVRRWRCHGKGRKERCTPLRKDAAKALRAWLAERRGEPRDPVFPNQRGGPLSHDSLAYLLGKHVATARTRCPSLARKRVSAHSLRHSCAMELLHSGVDRAVIALWLGHESVETTYVYLHADLKLKEKAMAHTQPSHMPHAPYRPDDDVLAFLNSL